MKSRTSTPSMNQRDSNPSPLRIDRNRTECPETNRSEEESISVIVLFSVESWLFGIEMES